MSAAGLEVGTTKVAPKVYISGGYAGSTRGGSSGGRVGMAVGF